MPQWKLWSTTSTAGTLCSKDSMSFASGPGPLSNTWVPHPNATTSSNPEKYETPEELREALYTLFTHPVNPGSYAAEYIENLVREWKEEHFPWKFVEDIGG